MAKDDYWGGGPLHDAVNKGDLEAVRRHLDSGVSVDLQDEEGMSALMYAAGQGRSSTVEVLIDRGAALDLQDEDGATALIFAAATQQTNVVLRNPPTPSHLAAQSPI